MSAAGRGRRAAAAAAPPEHGQPARERDARGRAAARLPGGERRRGRAATRACRSGRTSSRGSGAATAPRSASSRTPTPSSPTRPSGRAIPWSGDLADDHVWGRGALDMKNQVAASAVAIASLAREGFTPPGDLVFVAAADEEVGDELRPPVALRAPPGRGARRLRDQRGRRRAGRARRPRLLPLRGRGEDERRRSVLRVHGRSGHASMPGIADNALVKAAPLIEKLAAYRPEPTIGPEVAGVPRGGAGRAAAAPTRCSSASPRSTRSRSSTIEPLLSFTLSPTMIAASERRNVIPATCELDGRLAGSCPDRRRRRSSRSCARSSATGDYELETIERCGGTRSPLDTPLWDAISRLGRGDRAGRAGWRRSAAPASPTRTGCARRSARSRTASSRCGRWSPSWRRG